MAKAKRSKKQPATSRAASIAPTHFQLPEGVKAKRQVIMPTLNLQIGQPRVLKVLDAMRQSLYKDPDPKKVKEKPATICGVVDTQTGEAMLLLVPSVCESSLRESYPDDDYVDKTFYMEKLPKRPGKRYFDFRLLEVEAD